jgi:hypothetical protein
MVKRAARLTSGASSPTVYLVAIRKSYSIAWSLTSVLQQLVKLIEFFRIDCEEVANGRI